MHEPAGVVENLVQILQNTPILKYSFRIPPPPKWKLSEILALWLFSFRIPPPPKWKLSEILALWLFSFRIPPPPENWNLGRSWHFVTFQFQNTPPPPPENWNLGRSWHFVTFQFQNTPPPRKLNLGRSWHFVTSSQWETMCVELPHVETLSNPDNYSLTHLKHNPLGWLPNSKERLAQKWNDWLCGLSRQ